MRSLAKNWKLIKEKNMVKNVSIEGLKTRKKGQICSNGFKKMMPMFV